MRRGLKLQNCPIPKLHNRQRGYILITLMLFFALLAIAALAVLPATIHQIQRDREEEMIHRGTEYRRAIKKYYKKFGRYPSRVEELENTNNLRFLRKRYKDPLFKDKDFRVIRQGDPSLNMLGMGGLGRGLGQPLGPGGKPGPAGVPGVGGGPASQGNSPLMGLQQQPEPVPVTPPTGDSENAGTQSDPKTEDSSSSASSPGLGGQVFGGGAIFGVASASKEKTIREFNRKNHYNDWLFIYDPSGDRGGLLTGPVQPDLNKAFGGGAQPGIGQPNSDQGSSPSPQPTPETNQDP